MDQLADMSSGWSRSRPNRRFKTIRRIYLESPSIEALDCPFESTWSEEQMESPPKACTPAWSAREGGGLCGPQGRGRHVRGRSPGRVRARADAPASLLRPVQIGWSPQHSLRGGRATYFDPYQIESSRFFIALHEHCGHAQAPFALFHTAFPNVTDCLRRSHFHIL